MFTGFVVKCLKLNVECFNVSMFRCFDVSMFQCFTIVLNITIYRYLVRAYAKLKGCVPKLIIYLCIECETVPSISVDHYQRRRLKSFFQRRKSLLQFNELLQH